MTKRPQLIYPTIDLFLYDLREGIGEYSLENSSNRQKFWQKIAGDIDEDQLAQLEGLENPEADYVQLVGEPFEAPLDGYCYALQLGDTYALQVNCSGEYKDAYTQERNEGAQTIQNLGKLKQIIAGKINHSLDQTEIVAERQGTIGQTWFVSVQIADSNQDPKNLAQACYDQLSPNLDWKPDFKEQGRLLGGRLYEYWHSPTNWNQKWEDFSQENYHIVICLFPAGKNITEIRQKIEEIYLDLTRLFGYRHKVVWAYWQSRNLSAKLKNQSIQIRKLIAQVRELHEQIKAQNRDLSKLEIALIDSWQNLSDYAVSLNELEFASTTIKANLENYKNRLQKIEKDTNSYLNVLSNFSNFAEEKYVQQVDNDCANLRPGVMLLENMISTISGLSKIEQTKRDSLQEGESYPTMSIAVSVAAIAILTLLTSLICTTIVIEQFPLAHRLPFFLTPAFLCGISVGLIPVAIAFILLTVRQR